MIFEIIDTAPVIPLFGQWEETMIWSCLQKIMGKIYGNHPTLPTAAMAVIGDFTFFAGTPSPELIAYKPSCCNPSYRILIPQTEDWTILITQIYQDRASIISRYATKKEPDVFNIALLEAAVSSLPPSYQIFMINEALYHRCKQEAWSADLVSLFPDYETYQRLGLGVLICQNQIPISGASSYSRYKDGIEIEIDTKEEYRRKGLAFLCGAKLILECLKRGLYPSWDAHSKISLTLAEKLGYHYSHTYTAIELKDNGSSFVPHS